MTSNAQTPSATASAAAALGIDPAAMDFKLVLDVTVEIAVELGRRTMTIGDVLALRPGSTVDFNKPAEAPLDICVNGKLVARGEAVVVGDRYGVRVLEIASPSERLRHSNQEEGTPR